MEPRNSPLRLLCSALTSLAIVLGAFVIVEIVCTSLSPRPRLRLEDDRHDSDATERTTSPELDVNKLARAMGVASAARTNLAEPDVSKEPMSTPVRSKARLSLTGTAITTPVRYSLCQLRNLDTGHTAVYGIGDVAMDWQIYAISKDRVLVEKNGQIESIEIEPFVPTPVLVLDKYLQ